MKKLLLLPVILLALGTSAQTKVLIVNPNCNLTVHPKDTAWLQALVTTSDGYNPVNGVTLAFATGPSTPLIGGLITDWYTGLQAKVRIPVTNLAVGTYTFTGIARTLTGGSMPFADTVFVVAAPPPPIPRKIKTVVFNLVNGVWVPTITYDDGSIQ